MWAIDSETYTLPIQDGSGSGDQMKWKIYEVVPGEEESHGTIVGEIIRKEFVYTMIHRATREKMSFIYSGDSVKPTLKTLKKYGAEALQPVVSFLRDNKRHPYYVLDGMWNKLGA